MRAGCLSEPPLPPRYFKVAPYGMHAISVLGGVNADTRRIRPPSMQILARCCFYLRNMFRHLLRADDFVCARARALLSTHLYLQKRKGISKQNIMIFTIFSFKLLRPWKLLKHIQQFSVFSVLIKRFTSLIFSETKTEKTENCCMSFNIFQAQRVEELKKLKIAACFSFSMLGEFRNWEYDNIVPST